MFLASRKITATSLVEELKPITAKREIEFSKPDQVELLCQEFNGTQPSDLAVEWCSKVQVLKFLKAWPRSDAPRTVPETKGKSISPSQPCLTLIGGYGNGTFKELSLDPSLFNDIKTTLRLPDRVEEMVTSIHGVMSRFVEYDGESPTSLLILFSTSKAPLREMLCALRVDIATKCMECLLFDYQPTDLQHVANLIRQSPVAYKNPVALLTLLLKECGRTTEERRQTVDDYILEAEKQTKSSPWKAPGRALSDDMTSRLSLHHSTLVFISRAVEAEIENWKFLMSMAEDKKTGSWLKGGIGEADWQGLLDDIDFEIAHTRSRRMQIACLKERIGVQMTLISNMIAHQETSQTNLIAILALVFAPASLIAGIFSAGIFVTTDESWIEYVGATVPITVLTVVAGVGFLQQQRIRRWGRVLMRDGETGESAAVGVDDRQVQTTVIQVV